MACSSHWYVPQTLDPLSRENIEWYRVPRGHILDMGVKIQGVNHGYTLELYTATYTGNSLYNARNGPIQRTRLVPRICLAIQLYSSCIYSRAIQDTAYTLYSPIRRPSDKARFDPSACPSGPRCPPYGDKQTARLPECTHNHA